MPAEYRDVVQWIIDQRLPLTALELHAELYLRKDLNISELLRFVEQYQPEPSVAPCSIEDSVMQDCVIPHLIVQYLRGRNEKLAAVTVEEAFGDRVSLGKAALAKSRPDHPLSLLDCVRQWQQDSNSNCSSLAENSSLEVAQLRDQLRQSVARVKQLESEKASTTSTNVSGISPPDEKKMQLMEKTIATLNERLSFFESKQSSLVRTVFERLPTILSSIEASKKEALVPLIVAVAEAHPVEAARSTMIFYLFNLYRRPDEEQRSCIREGLTRLCQKIDANAIEQIIVPEVWPLGTHRYHEKRALALTMAMTLAPFLGKHTRTAFLRNLLLPLASDPNTTVRGAVARALGVVWTDWEQTDMSQAMELVVLLFLDDKDSVVEAVEKILQSVVLKCIEQHVAMRCFVPIVLSSIAPVVRKEPLAYQVGEKSRSAPVAPKPKTMTLMQLLRKLMLLIKSTSTQCESQKTDHLDLRQLCREEIFPMYFTLLSSSDIVRRPHYGYELSSLMALTTSMLGSEFFPAVENMFLSFFAQSAATDSTIRESILTSFIVHYASFNFETEVAEVPSSTAVSSRSPSLSAPKRNSAAVISNVVIDIANGTVPWTANDFAVVCTAIAAVGKYFPDSTAITSDALWMCVEHGDASIRLAAVSIHQHLSQVTTEEVFMRLLWPQQLVLINDKSADVQLAAIRSLYAICVALRTPTAHEKVFNVIFAVVDAAGPFSALAVAVLAAWRDLMKLFPSEPREKYLYVQLALLCQQFSTRSAKAPESADVVQTVLKLLLEVLTAISQCAVISPQLAKAHLIPSLRLLAKDAEHSSDPQIRSLYVTAVRDYNGIEARLKPQREPRSFFEKVKEELKKHV